MPRLRLTLLVLLLLVLAFASFAYRSYVPRSGSKLDRSDVLPEGPGFAPRPAHREGSPTVAVGRWLHRWLDPALGLPHPKRRPAGEVEILADAVVLGRPGDLRVRVKRVDGTPARSIPVTVYVPQGVAAPTTESTDERGEVAFGGLPSGPGYVVEAIQHGESYAISPSARIGFRVEPDIVNEVEIALPGVTLEGIVVDGTTGEPIPGAAIEAMRVVPVDPRGLARWFQFGTASKETVLGAAVADGEGKFRLGPLAAGKVLAVWARAADGRLGAVGSALDDRGTSALRILIGRPPSVAGTVVDEDGRGVTGLLVRTATMPGETHTDSAGNFTFEWTGPYLVLERDGVSMSRAVASDPNGKSWGPLRFPTRTALLVRVVEIPGGGIPNAVVHLDGVDAGGLDEGTRYSVLVRTDATGLARVPVLPGRIERVRVDSGWKEVRFEADPDVDARDARKLVVRNPMSAGDVREVILGLRKGLSVRGRAVLGNGRPASRAEVTVPQHLGMDGDAYAVAGADGRFRLTGIEAGAEGEEAPQVKIRLSLAGVADREVDVSNRLSTAQDAEIDVGDVVLHPGAMLRGRVVDADAAPIAGARVENGRFSPRATTTDAQGVYRLVVSPGDDTSVRARAPGTRTRELTVRGILRAGEVRDVEPIVLRPAPTVRVHVVDLGGRPVAGAGVRVAGAPRDSASALPRTDASGWISLPKVEDEDELQVDLDRLFESLQHESILVTLADGTVVERDLAMSDDAPNPYEVVVRVPERFVLEGVVRDEQGMAVAGVPLTASVGHRPRGVKVPEGLGRFPRAARSTTTDAAGHYRILLGGVPGEQWNVTGRSRGRSATGRVVVSRDTSRDLVLLHGK